MPSPRHQPCAGAPALQRRSRPGCAAHAASCMDPAVIAMPQVTPGLAADHDVMGVTVLPFVCKNFVSEKWTSALLLSLAPDTQDAAAYWLCTSMQPLLTSMLPMQTLPNGEKVRPKLRSFVTPAGPASCARTLSIRPWCVRV